MKKLFALILAVMLLLTATVFADAVPLSIDAVDARLDSGDIILTLTFTAMVDQVTILVTSEEDAVSESKILHIDQYEGAEEGCNILIDEARAKTVFDDESLIGKTLYIRMGGTGIDTPVKTSVTISGTFHRGDVNEDYAINGKDVTLLRRSVAGGYGAVVKTELADVNKDSEVNGKDVTTLRRYVAGGYGVVIED